MLRNLLVLGCTLLFACTRTGTRTETEARPAPQSVQVPMDPTALVTALNGFGIDLYTRWGKENAESYALAPATIGLALLQLLQAASGETEAQIAHALKLGTAKRADVVEAARALQRSVFGASEHASEMRFASRLFVDESLVLNSTFAATSRTAFLSEIQRLRFAMDPAAGLLAVNRWAREATGGAIGELLPAGAIDASTRLVLVNAVRLDARWEHAFDVAQTSELPFNAPSGPRTVRMMQQLAAVGLVEHDAWSMIELPHASGRTTFQVLLPKTVGSFDSVDAALRTGVATGIPVQRVQLSLPRFEIAPSEARELRGLLADLGISRAFSPAAELPGLGRGAGDAEPVYLASVYQHSVVRVDERGTEAAAASAVSGARAGPAAEFVADHPFVFVVRDRATGLVLFIGRYVHSTSQ